LRASRWPSTPLSQGWTRWPLTASSSSPRCPLQSRHRGGLSRLYTASGDERVDVGGVDAHVTTDLGVGDPPLSHDSTNEASGRAEALSRLVDIEKGHGISSRLGVVTAVPKRAHWSRRRHHGEPLIVEGCASGRGRRDRMRGTRGCRLVSSQDVVDRRVPTRATTDAKMQSQKILSL